MKKLILSLLLFTSSINLFSQAASYTDPAQAYLRLLLEKDANTAVRIGSFKVIGSPYLFGEKHNSKLFAKEATVPNLKVSYNTYNQELEIFSNESEKPLIKDVSTVDSFYLEPDNNTEGFKQPLFFVQGTHIFSKEKCFFQLVYSGSKFSLYKKYKSELGYVSTNYVQSELRQFDLSFEYYYADNTKKISQKLKLSENQLKKEFKPIKDISAILEENPITQNPEFTLIKLFTFLNN